MTDGLIDAAVDGAMDRQRVHTLGMPSDRRISNELIDEVPAGASTEEITGPGGLLADLTKRLVERAMEVELTERDGYEPHREPPGGGQNIRNATTSKTLITEHGKVAIDAPRDRAAASSRRSARSASGGSPDSTRRPSRSIAAACRCATSARHLHEIYGVEVSPDLISKVTDGVMDDVEQ